MTQYETQRNRLIPFAEAEADRRVRKGKRSEMRRRGNEEYLHDFWSEYFHEAMNKLHHNMRLSNG